jgi:hypothetical protein
MVAFTSNNYKAVARPKVILTDKRSVKFTMMLTEGELARLVDLSEVCNKPMTVIAREKVFMGKFPAARVPRTDIQGYAQLKRIGNNINQLTRLANGGRLTPDIYELLIKAMSQLDLAIESILYDSYSENR